MPLSPVIPRDLPEAPWKHAPLLNYALLIMAGIGMAWCGKNCTTAGFWATLALGTAATTVILYMRFQKKRDSRFLIGIVGALCVMFSAATLLTIEYQSVNVCWPKDSQTWTGTVERIQKQKENGVNADIRLTDTDPTFAGRCIRAYIAEASTRSFSPGNLIVFKSTIRSENLAGNPGDFDYARFLRTHGISGQSYIAADAWKCDTTRNYGGWRQELLRLRSVWVKRYADYFQGTDMAILSALTLGEKSFLSNDTRDLFSETGASHILALSGLHLGILICLIHFLCLKWIRRRWLYVVAHLLTLCAVWIFVFLADAPLSLIRAATMCSILHAGNALRHSHRATLNNLSFAAIVILLCEPMALFDVGFQLSFCSVFAIVITGRYVWSRFPLPEWIDDKALVHILQPRNGRGHLLKFCDVHFFTRLRYALRKHGYNFFRSTVYPFFCVSLSAQLGTAPLVIYYFHIFPVYALLANLIVIPIAYFLLCGALMFFLIPVDHVQQAVACVLRPLLQFMHDALSVISQFPCAHFKLYPTPFTLFAVSLIPVWIYAILEMKKRRKRIRLIYALAVWILAIIGSETYSSVTQRVTPQIVLYRMTRATNIHFIRNAEESYLYTSVAPDSVNYRFEYIRKNFFEPKGIKEPQLIIEETTQNKYLLKEGNFFQFGQTRLYLLNHSLQGNKPHSPVPVKVLIVAYNCWNQPNEVFKYFRPRQVVLDNTLPLRLKKEWEAACEQLRTPCHNIYSQGAFILNLKN